MLNRETVLAIRRRYKRGYPRAEIAKLYGVSVTTVSNIGKRRTHKRVKAGGKALPPYPIQKITESRDGSS